MNYSRIVRAIEEMPWAIQPAKLEAIIEMIELRARGIDDRVAEEIRKPAVEASIVAAKSGGAIAVLPIFGTILQRMNLMSDFSGGTSTEKFTQSFRAALADNSVKSILLNVDSPGGSVYGVDELATEIFKARGQKPIVAVANSLAASAAYWLASAADELSVTPSGEVGSIGVFSAHFDESRLIEAMGVKATLISAGKFKTEGNPYEPLSEEARAAIQSRVDEYYGSFVDAVARNRASTSKRVAGGFGQGRVVGAAQAIELGMADKVATFDQVLTRLGAGPVARTAARSSAEEIDFRRRRLRATLGYPAGMEALKG